MKKVASMAILGQDVVSGRIGTPIRFDLKAFVKDAYGFYKLLSARKQAQQLLNAMPGSALRNIAPDAASMRHLASEPFVCSQWSSAARLQKMIEHASVIDQLGLPFNIHRGEYVEIVSFVLDGERFRLTMDQPRWLTRDGALTVSLWAGINRIYSVSFCLSDDADGRTAYVGGHQGTQNPDALAQNREHTKMAYGLRPCDFVFELFRILLPSMGVTALKCVANGSRYQFTRRGMRTIGFRSTIQRNYDDTWLERGGVLGDDGFFTVPLRYLRKEAFEIKPNKRSLYAKRYAMLDELDSQINAALRTELPVLSHKPS